MCCRMSNLVNDGGRGLRGIFERFLGMVHTGILTVSPCPVYSTEDVTGSEIHNDVYSTQATWGIGETVLYYYCRWGTFARLVSVANCNGRKEN